MSNYCVSVIKVEGGNIKPVNGADRIVEASMCGTSVVIGKNDIGKVGLYWPSDGVISSQILTALDLYAKKPDGSKGGGFFDANGRVRAQLFKGVRSDGFWMPLDKLEPIIPGITVLALNKQSFGEEDLLFIAGGNVPLGKKFRLSNPRREQMRQDQIVAVKKVKALPGGGLFKEHYDTAHLNNNLRGVEEAFLNGHMAIVTEKLHGTSGRTIVWKEEIKLPWWKRLYNWISNNDPFDLIKNPYPTKEHKSATGTRRTVKSFSTDTYRGFWGDKFAEEGRKFLNTYFCSRLEKRYEFEILAITYYYEIVGLEDNPNKAIQSGHDYKELLKDKEWKRRYLATGLPTNGKVDFLYGAKPFGPNQAYVYRIVLTVKFQNEVQELEVRYDDFDDYVSGREIHQVPVICRLMGETAMTSLKELMNDYDLKASAISASSIAEGFVLQFYRPGDTDTRTMNVQLPFNGRGLKFKGFFFKYGEGLVKDSGIQDVEEMEAEVVAPSETAVQVVDDVTSETVE